MNHDVFISFSSKDSAIADMVYHELENASVKCWKAPQSLNGGDEYEDIIDKAIGDCKVFVLVLSRSAMESRWVNSELTIAFNEYKHIIPFRIDQTALEGKMRVKLIQSHEIRAYPQVTEKELVDLVSSVKFILSESAKRQFRETINESVSELGFVDQIDYEDAQRALESKKYSRAVDLLLPLSIKGNRESQQLICQLYYDVSGSSVSNSESGSLVDGDIIRSLNPSIRETIMSIADSGADWANFIMHCYAYVQNDNLASYDYLKKAVSESDLGIAYLRLGIVYEWGLGVEVNGNHAMSCFYEAEKYGCHYVYSYLGQMHRYGDAEHRPNIEKAFYYYNKGVDHNDKRSVSQLMSLYLSQNPKMIKEAEDLLVRLSDLRVDDIDFYYGQYFFSLWEENDSSENRKCAIEHLEIAKNHRNSHAYGFLSRLYDGIDDNIAMQYAEEGYSHGDSFSYGLLAVKLLSSDSWKQNLERVWNITKERIDRFGVGADFLGYLFLNYDYYPNNDEGTLSSLKTPLSLIKDLDTSARIGDIDSCKCLISLYSESKYGLNDIEKENEYRRMAAELVISNPEIEGEEVVMDYARFLVKNSSILNNPTNIDKYLKPAIENGNATAAKIFLERYKLTGNGSSPLLRSHSEDSTRLFEKLVEKSNNKFKIWSYENAASYILKNNAYDIALFSDLVSLQVTDENTKEFQSFLLKAEGWFELERNDHFCRNRVDALLLKGYLEGLFAIPYHVIAPIRERLQMTLKVAPGYLSLLKEQIGALFPTYDKDKGIKDFLEKRDSLDAELFFALSSYDFDHVVNVDIQDRIMNLLLMPIRNDKCFTELIQLEDSSIVGDEELWSSPLKDIDNCYRKVCEKIGLNPVCDLSRCSFESIAPFFPSSLVVDYRRLSHRALVSVIMHEKSLAPLLDILDNAEEVLNFAERLTDQDLQLFIVFCIEVDVEAGDILTGRYNLMESLVNADKKPFHDFVQAYLSRIENAEIQTDLTEADFADAIQQIFDQWTNGFV